MSLRDDIRAAGARAYPRCIVCTILDDLDSADRADLDECLADHTITGAAIGRVLHERGYPIHPDGRQVRRHRAGCK